MDFSLGRWKSKRESRTDTRPTILPPKEQPNRLSCDLSGNEDDPLKKLSKDEAKKIEKITTELTKLGYNVDVQRIRQALQSRFAGGDPEKALELVVAIERSNIGLVEDINSDVNFKLLGAENNGKATCYLDTLLFAMFAGLDSFEAMLYDPFDETDEKRKRLSRVILLFVNILRKGHLVTTDIISQIQQALADCGWEEAGTLQQQDTSEAFTFITEMLQLPMLTVKVDIAHGGKEMVDDDHKFISERLLNVALPPFDPEDTSPISLETCLKEHFTGRVDVKRQLERRTTIDSVRSTDSSKCQSMHIETSDLGSSPVSPIDTPTAPSIKSIVHEKKPELLRKIKVEKEVKDSDGKLKRTTSVHNEIMLPAWCFFNILPFYTDSAPKHMEFAEHFATKRPVLGLCLKRYSWSPTDGAKRDPRKVEIPLEIGFPTFVTDDDMGQDDRFAGKFKLVLQSAVCHRGVSVQSGHYIALVRRGRTWFRFNDLNEPRVEEVDHEKAFEEESPYLLFYQMQPIEWDDSTTSSTTVTPSSASTRSLEKNRLSIASTSSGGWAETPTIHEPGVMVPPNYEKHENPEGIRSPPPPYVKEAEEGDHLKEPTLSFDLLRPSSRSDTREDSASGSRSTSRPGSKERQLRESSISSWTSSLRKMRGKSVDKGKKRNSMDILAKRESEDGGTEERSGDDTTENIEPEGKKKNKGKSKFKEKSEKRKSRDTELKECVIQ